MKKVVLTIFILLSIYACKKNPDVEKPYTKVDTTQKQTPVQEQKPQEIQDRIYTIEINKNEEAISYSQAVSRQLSRISSQLNDGVKNTRFYSLTTGTEVIHTIKDGVLHFITPTESELQKDFQPNMEYTYRFTPSDPVSKCFKFLRWGGTSANPVKFEERTITTWYPYGSCSYHPFVFEGQTTSGEYFRLNYLIAMSGAPVPYNYSTTQNSISEITMENMSNYGVATTLEPLVIKIHGDWKEIQNLSIRNMVKGIGTNVASKLVFNEEEKTYTMYTSEMTAPETTLNFYGDIIYNSNPKNPRVTKDTAGYEIYVFQGKCTVKGSMAVNGIHTPSAQKEYALLNCSVKNGTHSFNLTQRQELDQNGAFNFVNVPQNAKCTVKVWDENNLKSITAKINYNCN